jgi:HNH endonuclease
VVGTPDKDGYIVFAVNVAYRRAKTVKVHQWVARTFLGPLPDGHEVDHRNRLRWDNRPSNLRYLSFDDNRPSGFSVGDRARWKQQADAAGHYARKTCGACGGKGHNRRTCPSLNTAAATP